MDFSDGSFLDGCAVETEPTFNGPMAQGAIALAAERFGAGGIVGPHWGDHLMAGWPIASNLIVKDRVGDGATYTNRFWGTGLVSAFGMDATGRALEEYYSAKHVEQLKELYTLTFDLRTPVKIAGNAMFFEGRDFVNFESAQIPLYDADGNPAHVLVAYDFLQ